MIFTIQFVSVVCLCGRKYIWIFLCWCYPSTQATSTQEYPNVFTAT